MNNTNELPKYITDERTGLKYELVGDYYLIAGDDEPEEKPHIGKWGWLRDDYLKKEHRLYRSMDEILLYKDSHYPVIDSLDKTILINWNAIIFFKKLIHYGTKTKYPICFSIFSTSYIGFLRSNKCIFKKHRPVFAI